jgi:PAS domain S-box-containing protein
LETSTQDSVMDGDVTRPPVPRFTDTWLAARLQGASRIASLVAVAVGCLVLVGWWLNVGFLKSIGPSFAAMKPYTALGFVLCGVALWNSKEGADERARRIAVACAVAVTLFGGLTLLEYATTWNLGFDRLLFDDASSPVALRWPGRMAPVSALNFMLFGLAILLLDRRLRGVRPSNWLTLLGAFMALLPLVGYFYGVEALYAMAAIVAIALHTSLTFLVLFVGVLCARPDRGVIAIVTSPTSGGEMARRLFPAVTLFPVAVGWIELEGHRAGLYGVEFGFAVFVSSMIVSLSALTWWTTRTIIVSEGKRAGTQRALAVRDAQLVAELRLRSMTDAAQDAIVSAGPTGAIVGWSRGAQVVFGYTEAEALGKSLTLLVPERHREAHREQAALAGAGGKSIESWGLRSDGTEFPCELSVGTWESDEGSFSTRIIRDVTDRKRSDDALRRSEEKYRRIIETTQEAVSISDAEGRYTFANRRMGEMLGYEPGELTTMSMFDLMDGEALTQGKEILERRRKHEPLNGEIRIKHKGGGDVWVSFEATPVVDDGRYVGNLSMFVDITARKATEQALREREESLAVTLNSIGDGVIATDGTGIVIRVNPVAERLLGLPGPSVLGRPIGDVLRLVHETTRSPVESPVDRALKDGVAGLLASGTILVRADGSELPIADSCAPIRDVHGEIAGAVLVFRDVTDERAIQQAKEKMQSQLIFADRMASVGTLAAGVGHEINNPLANVMGNLELLADGLLLGDPSFRERDIAVLVAEARVGAERIRKIVRGLKTFSRTDAERRQPLDLNRVLETAFDLASHEIELRARLVKSYGDVPIVEVDEARLGQVFINLLGNAAQAIPEGHPDLHEVRVTSRTGVDGRAIVEIRDTGPGIEPQHLGRIFEPFFTTKPVGTGTGLGLSICHGIVTELGGELTVESEIGRGSVFRVVLPPAITVAIKGPLKPTNSARAADRPGRVLVVDDDETVRTVLLRILKRHAVTVAKNGREALAILSTGARFDVVLCDLMMPEMNGMDLHAELSRELPDVSARMVFMTGGVVNQGARVFLDDVANERVEKPFDMNNLRALVQRFIQ